MQTGISIHDSKGEILRTISCPQSMVSIQEIPENGGYVEGAWDGRTHWAIGGEAFPRPSMNPQWANGPVAADGAEIARLENLPDPCRIVYEGPGFKEEGDVAGGFAEFTTDAPGEHTVKISAWPFLDWTGGFDAV